MIGRKKVKEHLSDDEGEETATRGSEDANQRALVEQLENTPAIPDSEISPAAYLFQQHEEQEEMNMFEEQSTKVKCPFCDAVSYSIVEYRANIVGYLFAILAIFVFGFLSLILMPFLVSLTKSAVHRCAKCLNEVKSNNGFFGASSMEDKIITWNIGNFGIILTRKYLLYIVMGIVCSLLIYLVIVSEANHNHEIRAISNITWEEYRNDCSYDAFIKSPPVAIRNFDRKYFNAPISWDGYIIRINS